MSGHAAWVPDVAGRCCLLVSLVCLFHAARVWSGRAGTGVWSLTLLLLAAVTGLYRITSLPIFAQHPHLIMVGLVELLILAATAALVAPDAVRSQTATPAPLGYQELRWTPAIAYRGGRVMRGPGRFPTRVSMALAGLVLTVAAAARRSRLVLHRPLLPVPSRLASAIVLQPGAERPRGVGEQNARSARSRSPGRARSTLPAGGTDPVSSPSTPTGVCFRQLGKPVTFTSAGVAVAEQPARSQPVQQPASWVVRINLPAAEAAELAAVTTRLAGTQDQLAIIIAGQTWAMPLTLQPLTGGEFAFSAESKNQALRIQRLLQ